MMKPIKIAKILLIGSMSCIMNIALAGGLSSINTGISNNADTQVTNGINLSLPFVVSDWSILSNYYSQNSTFPAVGVYAVETSVLSNIGVQSISNSGSGTLEVRFASTAPGPLANNGFALAPTCMTLRGNTFYLYELVQCFTNVTDSLTSQVTPQPNTAIGVFSNSNLGTKCGYQADPYAAAITQVLSCTTPTAPLGGTSA